MDVVSVVDVNVVSRAFLSHGLMLFGAVCLLVSVGCFTWLCLPVGDWSCCLNDDAHHASLGGAEFCFLDSAMVPVPATYTEESESVFQWVLDARDLLSVVCEGGPCALGGVLRFRP